MTLDNTLTTIFTHSSVTPILSMFSDEKRMGEENAFSSHQENFKAQITNYVEQSLLPNNPNKDCELGKIIHQMANFFKFHAIGVEKTQRLNGQEISTAYCHVLRVTGAIKENLTPPTNT